MGQNEGGTSRCAETLACAVKVPLCSVHTATISNTPAKLRMAASREREAMVISLSRESVRSGARDETI